MKSARAWPVFLGFGVAMISMLLAAAVAMLLWLGPRAVAQSPSSLGLTGLLVTTGAAEAALLLCALAFSRRSLVDRLRLGPAPVRPLTLTAIAVGTLAIGQVMESISTLLGFYEVGSLAHLRDLLSRARGLSLLSSFLVIGVLAGCAEELFFRGFAQTRLVQRWNRTTGVVVTSILFGLMHMDLVHSILAGGLGVWLGFTTERAGSIRPAIFAHAANNMVATAMAAAGLASPAVLPNLIVGALSAAIFALCAWQVVKALPATPVATPQPAGA